MADKCGKCALAFQTSEVIAKCTDCKSSFHPACTRLGSAKNFTKAKKSSWKCDLCTDETSSTRSSEDVVEDKTSILAALSTLKNDIISSMDTKIVEVRTSIDSLTSEFKTLNTKFETLEKTQNELRQRCDMLERANIEACDEIQELRKRLLDMEQYSRSANIEVQGLPLTQREDVYILLKDLAAALGVAYSREDISIAHRLRLHSKRLTHPPIIVQFLSRSVKEAWIAAARQKRGFPASMVSASLPASTVYVNEHLTANNKALLGRARRLMREKKLHFAGLFNGKILIKPKEGDEAQRVLTHGDLDKFDH